MLCSRLRVPRNDRENESPMSEITIPSSLAPLVRYLEGLRARPELGELRERLSSIEVDLEDLAPLTRFDESHYLRNLVCDNNVYELLIICWRSGQRSPIHNHARSVCGFRVLKGVATETVFEHAPNGLVVPVETRRYREGAVVVSKDDDTHQVSNVEPEGEDLVTMHVYAPPLRAMDMFSLTDSTVRQFRPYYFENMFGDGI